MKRGKEIQLLLDTVDEILVSIDKKYEEARLDDDVAEVLRPSVKSALEHLRSALEYSRHEIWESYTRKGGRGYFPYAFKGDKKSFDNSVDKNLSGLNVQRPEIYRLLESIQPYAAGSPWLKDLCDRTNFNKHNSLSKQVRKNSPSSKVSLGGFIGMENCTNVTLRNINVDGRQIVGSEPITISTEMTSKELKQFVGNPADIVKEFDWVEFALEGTADDLRKFLNDCTYNVRKFVEDLRPLL